MTIDNRITTYLGPILTGIYLYTEKAFAKKYMR